MIIPVIALGFNYELESKVKFLTRNFILGSTPFFNKNYFSTRLGVVNTLTSQLLLKKIYFFFKNLIYSRYCMMSSLAKM